MTEARTLREQLRQEYNAAVANGLRLRARLIERRLNAMAGDDDD